MSLRRRPRNAGAARGRRLLGAAGLLTVLATSTWGLPASAQAAPTPAPVVAATDPAPSPAPEDEATMPVLVRLETITPTALDRGQDLVVTGTLRNTGTATVTTPRVLVGLERQRGYISRSSLDRWRGAGPQDPVGATVMTVELPTPLPPGTSTPFSVTVPAAQLGLRGTSSWGPRGLAVVVVDAADPARTRLGVARSFVLWFPQQEVTPTHVSVLAPVVGPAVDPHGVTWVDDLDALARPGGRLAALLAATGEHPDVTWAVDPSLIEATQGQAGAGPSAGAVSVAWSSALLDAMTRRDTVLLPYADADPAALTHTGRSDLLEAAMARSDELAATTDLPDSATVSLLWPAEREPDLATAALAAAHDQTLVVGPGVLPAPDVLTYTPTGLTTVTTARGDVDVLLPDDRLSTAFLTGAVRSSTTDSDGAVSRAPSATTVAQLTPATAAQDLLAELAVVTRERPSDARHLLVTVPRTWSPDPAVVDAQLTALETAPWVDLEPLTALIGAAEPDVDRGTLPGTRVDGAEITASELRTLTTAVSERTQLAQLVADPSTLLGDTEAETLAPVSIAWRDDPAGRAAVVEESRALTQALRGAVEVAPVGDLTLIAETGGLPVRVTNTLDQDVTVRVELRPDEAWLVADAAETVTIPAGGEQRLQIPVHAVQSGEMDVAVEVRTSAGVLVDDSTVFHIQVRADWEGIGTAVIGALLAVGVVIGLIRTIRRGRTGRRSAPVSAGPDALSPEEEAEAAEAAEAAEPADAAPHEAAEAAPHEAAEAAQHEEGAPAPGPGTTTERHEVTP